MFKKSAGVVFKNTITFLFISSSLVATNISANEYMNPESDFKNSKSTSIRHRAIPKKQGEKLVEVPVKKSSPIRTRKISNKRVIEVEAEGSNEKKSNLLKARRIARKGSNKNQKAKSRVAGR